MAADFIHYSPMPQPIATFDAEAVRQQVASLPRMHDPETEWRAVQFPTTGIDVLSPFTHPHKITFRNIYSGDILAAPKTPHLDRMGGTIIGCSDYPTVFYRGSLPMPARLRDAYDEEYDDRAVNPGYVLFNPSYPNEDALDIFEAALKNNTLERRTLPPGVLFYLFPGTIHHTPQVTDEEFEPNKIYRVLHGHFNLIPRRTAQDLIEFVNASV